MSGLAIRVAPTDVATSLARAQSLLVGIKECGPDQTVAVVRGPIEVAHAAFFTTPESRSENFPVTHPTRDVWVVADARLDYRDDLRSKLRSEGCSFEPKTDADFILAAHEVWGDEAQTHLTGDFAYAIWDAGRLVVARDVLGMRPLWWAMVDDETVIASTIRGVLAQLPKTPSPNQQFIADLLVSDLSRNDYTPYAGVHRLEPGARLIIVPGESPVISQVDRLRLGAVADVGKDAALTTIRAGFERAVQERMRTIGPVACELSGGLDSSTVVGLVATTANTERLLAISNVFPGQDCDESGFIRSVSDRFGLELRTSQPLVHNAIDLRNTSRFTRDIVAFPDQNAALWSLASSAGCRTVLTGQGGDEAFGAPDLFESDLAGDLGPVELARMFLAAQRSTRRQLIRSVVLQMMQRFKRIGDPIERCLDGRRRRRISWVGKSIRSEIAPARRIVPGQGQRSGWNRTRRHATYVSPNSVWAYENLHQSSAGVVDLRHPFLDRRFVELSLSMPTEILYPEGTFREFHRQVFADLLPPDIASRTDKAEFSSIYRASIVHNAPNGFEKLSSHHVGWTNPLVLTGWADDFLAGESSNLFALWHTLAVSCWLDAVADEDGYDA